MLTNNIKDRRVPSWMFNTDPNAEKFVDLIKKSLIYFDVPLLDPCCEFVSDIDNLTNRELTLLARVVISGSYTPTVTEGANVASSTPGVARYQRIGNVVHYSGTFTVTPTLTATTTVVELTLPIASNFAATTDASGSGTATGTSFFPIDVSGSIANDTLVIRFTSSGTGAHTISFTSLYDVI